MRQEIKCLKDGCDGTLQGFCRCPRNDATCDTCFTKTAICHCNDCNNTRVVTIQDTHNIYYEDRHLCIKDV